MEINKADKKLRFRLIPQRFSYCQIVIRYFKNTWLNTYENPHGLYEYPPLNFSVIVEKWIYVNKLQSGPIEM